MVEECLRWCTVDWLAVVVAETDAEAHKRAELAKAEHLAMRKAYNERYGAILGPAVARRPGQGHAAAYAAGGDMANVIAGSPNTVARKVKELRDLGINHLLVRFLGEWPGAPSSISAKSMRLFSRDVIPRFTNIAPPKDPLELAVSVAG